MSDKIEFDLKLQDYCDTFSLQRWQQCFNQIFEAKNAEIKVKGFNNNTVAFCRGYIVSHIGQDLGVLAENINELDREEMTKKSIPAVFAWICALANELKIDLASEVLYKKFPGYCKTCGLNEDCEDPWWTKKESRKNKNPNKEILNDKEPISEPTSLNGWIDMWFKIFGRKYKTGYNLTDIILKMHEEYSEVLEQLDEMKDNQVHDELKEEIADLLSWLFALMIRLFWLGFLDKNKLPELLVNKFEKGCRGCSKQPCECPLPCWIEKNS